MRRFDIRRFVVGTVAVGAVGLAPHPAFAIGGVRRRWLCHAIAEEVEAQQLGERRKLGEKLRLREPSKETRVVAMMVEELAHHHHALPLGYGHEELATAAIAELAERLRRLVLAVGREVGRAQHEAALAVHGGEHLVELALEPATLRRAVAQEYARIRGKAVLVFEAQVEDGDIL